MASKKGSADRRHPATTALPPPPPAEPPRTERSVSLLHLYTAATIVAGLAALAWAPLPAAP